METTTFLAMTASIVAALFGVLSVIVGWIGARTVNKQDEILKKLDEIKDELHSRINHVGMRLVQVETKMGIYK